ncbi:lycopene cyclase domain-containing protein [Arsenicicoccus piscis]|uniref:Lycopene cyclase n=1 Tax=Arsenicicoccus piscis TaxID=673954 RepID=A0ABQ6HVM3_9MICO|nr:lycopene cyclase domain-containing protein [Arsenicicoccus piscis]MCH8627562.1 lycopene cyclase domain-containing protein [Arsenicicoccus piscis]GMA18038.1 lycopene cyclase [Arsenicicoccus piscis]GMA21749.1 lycopene cyclase [Arsenicicoccus piscis]
MPEYTVLSILSVGVVLVLDRRILRTRVTSRRQFWSAMAIVAFFQCLVDGWLTKLTAPIVEYSPSHMLGLRAPWDIPVEDFAFGFSMVTATIVLWVHLTAPADPRQDERTSDRG